MASTNINPFGQTSEMPAGYPIADNLTTNSAQQALSAKQGKLLGDELHTLKILSLGNSFGRDSMAYVPIILKEKFGIKLEICLLVEADCSLQAHYTNRQSTTFYDFCFRYDHATDKWTKESNKGLSYALGLADWDIVMLQQNSGNSMDYTTYQPYLNDLIDYIAGIKPNVVFAWNLTHAWATGYSSLTTKGVTMDEMAAAVKSNADKVLDETAVSMILPYGEAIRFAREDETLAAIGEKGNLSHDWVHLQEGIGRQVAAYANVMAILRFLHGKKGVVGDTTTIDSSFLSAHGITTTDNNGTGMTNESQNGTPTGSTATNRLIAQRCAVMANNEYNYGTDHAKKTE